MFAVISEQRVSIVKHAHPLLVVRVKPMLDSVIHRKENVRNAVAASRVTQKQNCHGNPRDLSGCLLWNKSVCSKAVCNSE